MRRALLGSGFPLTLTLALTFGLAGCARPKSTAIRPPSAPSAKAPGDDAPGAQEIGIGTLPRGRLARAPDRPLAAAKTESIPGIVFDVESRPARLSGVKDTLAAFNVELRDPPDAATAFCVGVPANLDTTSSISSRPPLVTPLYFAIPVAATETEVRAERIEAGPTPSLVSVVAFATSGGGIRKVAEARTPLQKLAEMAGVEVFAFVEEGEPGSPTEKGRAKAAPRATGDGRPTPPGDSRPRLQVIVKRPPLRKGSVSYVSFLTTDAFGAKRAAACGHARIGLPIEHGDGATSSVDVAVETELGARPLRIHFSTLWLKNDPESRLGLRLGWAGPSREHLSLQDPERDPRLAPLDLR